MAPAETPLKAARGLGGKGCGGAGRGLTPAPRAPSARPPPRGGAILRADNRWRVWAPRCLCLATIPPGRAAFSRDRRAGAGRWGLQQGTRRAPLPHPAPHGAQPPEKRASSPQRPCGREPLTGGVHRRPRRWRQENGCGWLHGGGWGTLRPLPLGNTERKGGVGVGLGPLSEPGGSIAAQVLLGLWRTASPRGKGPGCLQPVGIAFRSGDSRHLLMPLLLSVLHALNWWRCKRESRWDGVQPVQESLYSWSNAGVVAFCPEGRVGVDGAACTMECVFSYSLAWEIHPPAAREGCGPMGTCGVTSMHI